MRPTQPPGKQSSAALKQPKPRAPRKSKPPELKPHMMTLERNSPRGLVPSRAYGRLDETYNAYLDELDPLGKGTDPDKSRIVQEALAMSRDQRFSTFFERIHAPQFKRMTLATVAKSCDITYPEFAEFMQSANKAVALARAQAGVVGVTSDMVQDARSKEVTCGRCDGYGVATDDLKSNSDGTKPMRTCPDCSGTGKTRLPGDTDSRKLLLEMTGLAGKKGPTVQVNNNNFGGAGIESAMGSLGKVSFDLEEGAVIDVTSGSPDSD